MLMHVGQRGRAIIPLRAVGDGHGATYGDKEPCTFSPPNMQPETLVWKSRSVMMTNAELEAASSIFRGKGSCWGGGTAEPGTSCSSSCNICACLLSSQQHQRLSSVISL